VFDLANSVPILPICHNRGNGNAGGYSSYAEEVWEVATTALKSTFIILIFALRGISDKDHEETRLNITAMAIRHCQFDFQVVRQGPAESAEIGDELLPHGTANSEYRVRPKRKSIVVGKCCALEFVGNENSISELYQKSHRMHNDTEEFSSNE
jgi:hypothetical protein